MGRIVWPVQVSADDFLEGEDGDLSRHRVDEELHDTSTRRSRRWTRSSTAG